MFFVSVLERILLLFSVGIVLSPSISLVLRKSSQGRDRIFFFAFSMWLLHPFKRLSHQRQLAAFVANSKKNLEKKRSLVKFEFFCSTFLSASLSKTLV